MTLKKLRRLKYYDNVEGINAVVYLYENNHFDILDELLTKQKNILEIAYELKYIYLANEEVFNYVAAKAPLRKHFKTSVELKHIELITENT